MTPIQTKIGTVLLLAGTVLAVPSVGPSVGPASDWPQWRGPNRDGVAAGARFPSTLPEKLPAPTWSRQIGLGYSAPAVRGGRVYIMARRGPNEYCLCLDGSTGREIWHAANRCDFVPPDERAGTGPNSTPTVDGDRVYTLGLGGMFQCLDAQSGRVLWRHDFATEYWGVEKDADGTEAWMPECGASACALVVEQEVVVPVGGPRGGSFGGFDRRDGRLVWTALPDRSSYASPLLAALGGKRQIVGYTGKRMVGLDVATHALLWEVPVTAQFEQTIVSPVVWKDRVFIGEKDHPTVAMNISSEGGGARSGEAWRSASLRSYLTTPIVVEGALLGFDSASHRIVALDAETGKVLWSSPRVGNLYVSLTAAGDLVLALSDDGTLRIIRASRTRYEPLRTWTVGEPSSIWSPPALTGGSVYIKSGDRLSRYDIAR